MTTVGVAPAGAGAAIGGQPRRIAYADPPYPGMSRRYYADHPDFAGEVDHGELIGRLSAEYDTWALSTSAAALPAVLALCPPGVAVAAWFRGHRPHRRAASPLNAWEPVIYGGLIRRAQLEDVSHVDELDPPGFTPPLPLGVAQDLPARVDALVHVSRPRLTDPDRVVGAKPAAFSRWLFELLAAQPGDELVDVFPGSGGVARAWAVYTGARVAPTG
ncbi:hypothetical protein [Jatrophihabitans sp.]|uniref:hypothetical protein n=1 Tax=Jatrophihabitans sp. TaxID=1932789 RepID=UPI0030C6F339